MAKRGFSSALLGVLALAGFLCILHGQGTTLPIRFDARQYGFKGGERISLIQENGKKDLGKTGPDGQVAIEVPSREAYIIELLRR